MPHLEQPIMADNTIIPISTNFLTKVERLFKAGAITISAGFIGLLCVVYAGFRSSDTDAVVHGTGCVLILSSLSLFLYASRRAHGATEALRVDLPLLDDLQRTAFQVTEIADITQSFAFKHLMRAQRTFTAAAPILEKIPIVGPAYKRSGFVDFSEISSRLAMATLESNNRIRLLQDAIRNADLRGIQEYGRQLDAALVRLRSTLNIETDA
ncbi:MAG: hypothetical protein JNL87_21380 [Burkholderiaceae bacterium]|nr:hypothetical protein [Burkholderiaceae bacterium]